MDENELSSWVLGGPQHRIVLRVFEDGLIPTLLVERVRRYRPGASRNSVSDTLREFRRSRVLEVRNPKARQGRIYQLTPVGRRVKREVVRLLAHGHND